MIILMIVMSNIIIFTDLDGTLLDEMYSYDYAIPTIRELKRMNIPIVFCSAKTKAEQEIFRARMGIKDPFIVEDGSAIYVPRGYFKRRCGEPTNGYEVIVLGVRYEEIVKRIEELRRRYRIVSYHFMSVEEIAEITGLSLELARLAKMREFSETIVFAEEEALNELKGHFNVAIGGRFIHVYGKNADKGKAVRILTDLYKEIYGDVISIGIGNSYTDEPMLKAVDIPALVKNPDCWADLNIKNLYKAGGIATVGWVEVVERFVLG